MSEGDDYDPGPWTGRSFSSARATYDVHVGRSYSDAKRTGKKSLDDLVPKSLSTDSTSPLVIACDVTGSMGDWPATIFSKLPYLDLEGKEYLGDDMEISFCAVGDVHSDDYPLQVQNFCAGTDMEKSLKKLIIEGGGGGGIQESYDLPALFYGHNVSMPNAMNPIFIFIGDEGIYDFVNKDDAKNNARTNVQGRISGEDAIRDLTNDYSVYLVRKPYHTLRSNGYSSMDQGIHKQWADILGEDHISILPEAGRVVDVIFGILAKETGRVDYFADELNGRQTPEQVDTVMKSLKSIHEIPNKVKAELPKGASMTHRTDYGEKTKPLI